MTNTMEWRITEYNQWIKDGQPINLLVTNLDISNSNINSLNGIENLVNLTILKCSENQLTSLNGIENLVNLTTLYCGINQLTSLNGIENLVNLRYVRYIGNLIVHIPLHKTVISCYKYKI